MHSLFEPLGYLQQKQISDTDIIINTHECVLFKIVGAEGTCPPTFHFFFRFFP